MTREEFNSLKNTVDSDQQSIYLYKAYVLSLEEEVEKLKQQKRYLSLDKSIIIGRWLEEKQKARSIVAMLFGEMKRQNRQYYKVDYSSIVDEERAFGSSAIATFNFKQAYAMLKDN